MSGDRYHDMSRPVRWSVVLHIALILLAIFGLPQWQDKPEIDHEEIVVDLVTPEEITTAPNTTQEKPDRQKEIAPKPAPEPESETTAPQEEPDRPAPAPKSEGVEEMTTPPPDKPPPPDRVLERVPSMKPVVKQDEDPEEKPDKETTVQPKQDEFTSVLKNLVAEEEPEPEEPAPSPNVDAPIDKTQPAGKAPTQAKTLSISEVDALKRQLARCWNIPIGAAQAEDLSVEIDAVVGPDRTVKQAEIVDQRRYSRDPFFRAAAESARRALLSTQCSPLALPPEKYHLWNRMRIRFDPQEMFGEY